MKQWYLFLFLMLLLPFTGSAQDCYLPDPSGQIVSDYEGLLTDEEAKEIAALIRPSYEASSNQLMIICIPTKFVGSLTIEEYANRLFKKWQPGQKGLNNGVLMIISGSQADSVGRKLRIEVGYGLEGVLPDLLCKRIQMDLMVPKLKAHKYYEALKSGSLAIIAAISNENKGHQVVFRNKAQAKPYLNDEVGLLSLNEFIAIENAIKEADPNNEVASVIMPDGYYEGSENRVNLSDYGKSYPLFYLTLASPYTITEGDSGVQIKRNNSPGTTLTANILLGQSVEERNAFESRVRLMLDKRDYKAALLEAVNFYKEGRQSRWNVFAKVAGIQIFVVLLMIVVFYLMKNKLMRQQLPYFATGSKENVFLILLMVLCGVVTFPNVVSFEMPQTAIWASYLDLNDAYMYTFGSLLFVLHVAGIVYLFKAGSLRQPSKRSSSGSGYSYGGNSDSSSWSSSSSSSSDYSSSDSSYSSSDSNSDYGGGGGDSGGGGSSSDW